MLNGLSRLTFSLSVSDIEHQFRVRDFNKIRLVQSASGVQSGTARVELEFGARGVRSAKENNNNINFVRVVHLGISATDFIFKRDSVKMK